MKKFMLPLLSVILCFIICGCSSIDIFTYNMAELQLEDKKIIEAQGDVQEAYYLDENHTLYSPGANSDAGRYVCYQNEKKGIVAENVTEFGTFSWGGYYIDENNSLWMWSRNKYPEIGYTKNRRHRKILDNVKHAYVEQGDTSPFIIYEDLNSDLYFLGTYKERQGKKENPLLLARHIRLFEGRYWINENGSLGMIEENKNERILWDKLFQNEKLDEKAVTQFEFLKDGLVLLQDHALWFSGRYQKLLKKEPLITSYSDKEEQFENQVLLLSENISCFKAGNKTIVALNEKHQAYVWGMFCGNHKNTINEPIIWTAYENKWIKNEIREIGSVDSFTMVLVDLKGKTLAYGANPTEKFLGDSYGEEDVTVGFTCEPIIWKK